MDYTLVGLAAGTLTTICLLPQLISIIKTKSSKDVSLAMYLIFSLGVILWLVYGVLTFDLALIAANSVSFVIALAIILMKLRYG